jgi:hypothetical protein
MHQLRRRSASASATVRRAIVATLLAALGLGVIGIGPAVSAEDSRVSWALRTASNDFGADRQNFDYSLDPGGRIDDALMVVNHGSKALTLTVYAADGFTTEAGQLDLVAKQARSKGVGSWVKAGQDSVSVPAGKTVEVPFTIDLPKNATPGDHVGGIITSLATPGDQPGIEVDRRLAMRVHLRVGGELSPALKIEGLHLDHQGTINPVGKGEATIGYTIRNTGNATVTAQQAASVSGPFGTFRVRAAAMNDSPELLPGDRWKVEVPIEGVLSTGRLAATVRLTPIVTDASGTITPLAPVDSTTHAWAMPWSALALLVAVIALAAVAVRARRRRSAQDEARVQAAVADALRERETADH